MFPIKNTSFIKPSSKSLPALASDSQKTSCWFQSEVVLSSCVSGCSCLYRFLLTPPGSLSVPGRRPLISPVNKPLLSSPFSPKSKVPWGCALCGGSEVGELAGTSSFPLGSGTRNQGWQHVGLPGRGLLGHHQDNQ